MLRWECYCFLLHQFDNKFHSLAYLILHFPKPVINFPFEDFNDHLSCSQGSVSNVCQGFEMKHLWGLSQQVSQRERESIPIKWFSPQMSCLIIITFSLCCHKHYLITNLGFICKCFKPDVKFSLKCFCNWNMAMECQRG